MLKPRVHPNGFLQIDLPPEQGTGNERRLHVFHPHLAYISRQGTYHSAHTHRFGLISTVLHGALVDVGYREHACLSGGTHATWYATCKSGEETKLERGMGGNMLLHVEAARLVRANQTYIVQLGSWHETFYNEPTATLMTKSSYDPDLQVRVAVPVGVKPDNAFKRDTALAMLDPGRIYSLIRDALPEEVAIRYNLLRFLPGVYA